VLLIAAVAGCGFKAGGGMTDASPADADVDTVDAPPDAQRIDGMMGAARKKLITIDPAKVFADLANFPVWIRIANDNELKVSGAANGADIYFTLENGTPLEFELTRWNKTQGDLEAWVRIDLDNTAPTKLELRYGDPGPAHAPNALMTWSNGFSAVWHMDDALNGSTTVADARGQRMGTAVNGPTSIGGKLGRGIAFDGNDDQVTFTNPIAGNQASTISAWVDVVAPGTGFSSVLTVGNAATGQSRFMHTKYPNVAIGLYGSDLQPTNTGIDGQGPKLVHWVYDPNGNAGNTTLYIDGVSVATMNHGGMINTTGTAGYLGFAPGTWGPGGNTANPLHGTLDEVRIASTARTRQWIETEHANQSAPGSFYMIGLEQLVP
jgi:hypothetical protein